MTKRVVLVDGHVLMRQMLGRLLRREPGYEVVSEAGTGLEGWMQCRREAPSLVISHLALAELSGAEFVRRIRQQFPAVQVLVYSSNRDHQAIALALSARPHGMVMVSDSLDRFMEAIRVVSDGGNYYSPFVSGTMNRVFGCMTQQQLTPREREVLQLVAESFSSKEIAARLQLASKTVENHRQRLMEKLQLRDVAALTRYAIRHGLIDLSM